MQHFNLVIQVIFFIAIESIMDMILKILFRVEGQKRKKLLSCIFYCIVENLIVCFMLEFSVQVVRDSS